MSALGGGAVVWCVVTGIAGHLLRGPADKKGLFMGSLTDIIAADHNFGHIINIMGFFDGSFDMIKGSVSGISD